MREPSAALKGWAELAYKGLLIASLIWGFFKGAALVEAKSHKANAEKAEITQRTEALMLLTSTYTKLLSDLDAEIQGIDKKMGDEMWKNSIGWEKLEAIRRAKMEDRAALLQSLGAQIVQMKQAEK